MRLVHAIDRDRVLNEVVRADAEKIDFARERIGGDGRARNFDHRADFACPRRMECRLTLHLLCAFVQHRERAPQLVQFPKSSET